MSKRQREKLLLLLALLAMASCAKTQLRSEETFVRCYRLCDTEVRSLYADERGISCVCKVREEIPSHVSPVTLPPAEKEVGPPT